MLKDIQSFVSYFEGIRRRTLNYIKTIPADRLDWSPKDGEFTIRDIVLHIAATEGLWIGVVVGSKWKYEDNHADHRADSLEQLIAYLDQTHTEMLGALRTLNDDDLDQPRPTLENTTLKAWRMLMLMTEHEVHHRSQLAVYLTLMGIQPPQIYGLGIEDVIARATG